MPRVGVELAMFNLEPRTHFSYEDQSMFEIHLFTYLGTVVLTFALVKTYASFYKLNEKLCSPHPIMLLALVA